jgi:hypothetical protein
MFEPLSKRMIADLVVIGNAVNECGRRKMAACGATATAA